MTANAKKNTALPHVRRSQRTHPLDTFYYLPRLQAIERQVHLYPRTPYLFVKWTHAEKRRRTGEEGGLIRKKKKKKGTGFKEKGFGRRWERLGKR